ncbi:MAG: hypothetical protein ACSHW0_04325 [Thalassotalea sp.]
MKKIIRYFALTLLLSACGGGSTTEDTSAEKQPDPVNKITKNFTVSLTNVDITTQNKATQIPVNISNVKSGELTLEKGQ